MKHGSASVDARRRLTTGRFAEEVPGLLLFPVATPACPGNRTEGVDQALLAAIHASNGDPIPRGLAVHVRGPGCEADPAGATRYLERLQRQVAWIGDRFDRDRELQRLLLAGSLLPWLGSARLAELLASLFRHFHVPKDGQPTLCLRLSKAPARRTDWEALERAGVRRVRLRIDAGPAGLSRWLSRLPGGFAVELCWTGFAGLERTVARSELPAAVTRVQIPEPGVGLTPRDDTARLRRRLATLCRLGERLSASGWQHRAARLYVSPDDPWALRHHPGRLHCDCLGPADGPADLIGFGVGADSLIDGNWFQACREPSAWQQAIDADRPGLAGFLPPDPERALARDICSSLCGGAELPVATLEQRHRLRFASRYRAALAHLAPLFLAGLLRRSPGRIMLAECAWDHAGAIASHFGALPTGPRAPPSGD